MSITEICLAENIASLSFKCQNEVCVSGIDIVIPDVCRT